MVGLNYEKVSPKETPEKNEAFSKAANEVADGVRRENSPMSSTMTSRGLQCPFTKGPKKDTSKEEEE